ncbi:MAG: LacI family transcriptional regulator [Spirochaetia bacterium]|jgi:LacI family transcriptional regulator|nr:LacI family transcriptional regulator [Spirochaetia bacterium]
MGKKITISEVATELGVSKSAVSRAMNNSPGVSEPVKNRILKYISEIGYRPNAIARGLSVGNMEVVALILSDIRNPFYADLAFFIQRKLSENGYMLVIFNSENNVKKEVEFIKHVIAANFAGLILLTARNQAISDELKSSNMPIVLVNRMLDAFDYQGDSVILDNFKAGYIATMHLIEYEFPRIAYIKGQNESSASIQRYEGYKQAMNNYKIPIQDENILETDLKMGTGYELAKEYIKNLDHRAKGIVIGNDLTAIGFIEGCRESGIKVPEDISVVSFDNISFASLYDIGLTTVDQHVEEMSEQAVRLMLKQLNDKNSKPERVILDPKLIIRKTTKRYSE